MDPVQARMRAAFALHELAVVMRREVLKREHPHESEARIEERLRAWRLAPVPPRPGRPDEP